MNANLRPELQRLLSGMCDGDLPDANHARLEELLTTDAECRRFYLEYMDLNSQLLLKADQGGIPFPGVANVESATAIPSSIAAVTTLPGEDGRAAMVYRYFLVVVATLLVSALIQVFWWRPGSPPLELAKKQIEAAPIVVSPFVATLRDAVDCEWEASDAHLRVGARLPSGELRVPKGVANVQFDSGSELVVEGPAKLRLESSSAVTVLSGKVVLRADDSAAPFDLHTPTSVLAETGTEMAVAVSTDVEEVHVFEGEVLRKANGVTGAKSEQLKAGEAWRYDSKSTAVGKMTKCDPSRFVRFVAPSGPAGRDMSNGLLAYEGFEYRNAMAMTSGKSIGGKGWIGPWKPGFTRSYTEPDRPRFPLNGRESLSRPDSNAPSVGGSFEFAGYSKYFRRLARPVRLDTDGTHYVSYLFQRHQPPADPINSLGIQFWTHEDFQTQKFEDARQRLFIGVKKLNQATTRIQRIEVQNDVSLETAKTYLLVAKVSASRTGSDQLRLRIYGPADPVDVSEPTNWTLNSGPFQSDLVFDWLQLHINSKARQTLDEFRLGTTWAAVTSGHIKN